MYESLWIVVNLILVVNKCLYNYLKQLGANQISTLFKHAMRWSKMWRIMWCTIFACGLPDRELYFMFNSLFGSTSNQQNQTQQPSAFGAFGSSANNQQQPALGAWGSNTGSGSTNALQAQATLPAGSSAFGAPSTTAVGSSLFGQPKPQGCVSYVFDINPLLTIK